MDWVLFIKGVSALLLALAAYRHQTEEPRPGLSWNWLAVSALFIAAHAWVAMLQAALAPSRLLASASACLLFGATLPLSDFSRRGAAALGGRCACSWAPSVVTLVALLGSLHGLAGLVASLSLALGFSGACAGSVVIRSAPREGWGRRAMVATGAALMAWGVLTALFPPPSPIPVSSWLHEGVFLGAAGFPVQLPRTLLFTVAALCLGLWIRAFSRNPAERARPIARLDAAWLVLGLAGICALAGFGAHRLGKNEARDERASIQAIATVSAARLAPSDLASLALRPSDEGRPAFHGLVAELGRIQSVLPGVRWAYVVALDGPRIRIAASASPEGSPKHARPGAAYPDAPAGLREMLARRQGGLLGPYADRWGEFVTVCAPIPGTLQGRPALLALDTNASQWSRRVARARLAALVSGVFSSLLIAAAYVARFRLSQFTKALWASRHRLNQVVQTQREMICRWKPDSTLTFANHAYARFFGRTADGLVGKRWIELLPGPEREAAAASLPALLEDRREVFFNGPQTRADGAVRSIDWLVTPSFDQAGALTEFQSVGWDVTDRRRAEDALRNSESRFRQLFENASDAIFLHETDGRFLDVNEQACRSLGYTRDELCSLKVFDVNARALDVRGQTAFWTQLEERGQPVVLESLHRHRDGHTFPVEISISAMRMGGLPCILVFARDITARKRAEEALARTTERLALATRAAGAAVWEWDPARDTLIWDDRMHELYGIPRAAGGVSNAAWLACVHPEDRPRMETEIRQALAQREEFRSEFRICRADGQARHMRTTARIVRDAGGAASRVVGISFDVTDQRVAEEQLRHAQKMDAIGRLAGGLAHDFNNFLTVIGGNATLLLRRMAPDDANRGRVANIRQAAEGARSLTQQLLQFSRKQSSRVRVLDTRLALLQCESMLRSAASDAVVMRHDVAEDLWRVRVDPVGFQQVLINLVTNARDAMGRGGHLLIRAKNVPLAAPVSDGHRTVPDGEWVCLEVQDSGHGIPEENLGRLFEPFYTTKPIGGGLGLGLSIVHSIVTGAGGQVLVSSGPERGTVFSVYLPRCTGAFEETMMPEGGPGKPPPHGSGQLVLLAEDQPEVRAFLAGFLQDHGYRVVEATNGAEALETIADRGIDVQVLLSDIRMPLLSGTAAAEAVLTARPDVKVILMTAYSSEEDIAAAARRNVEVLHKPFPPNALLEALHRALHSEDPPPAERRKAARLKPRPAR
jgi:PAS domain S-box-containing protein